MKEGTLEMSSGERDRLRLMGMVKVGKMRLRKAAELLAVSYRQGKRIYRRYREEGDKGLVHRARGRPSNRSKAAGFKAEVIERYRGRYEGFGPTLASEKLAGEGYRVDHETLRRWLIEAQVWARQRKRRGYRRWRERKAHRGELVQMDGSHHDWFEGRGERAVLMNLVDDSTGTSFAQFHAGETTQAAMATLWGYIRRYGMPRALYVDRDTVYVTDREPTIQEDLAGVGPLTQFGRAAWKLGIEIITANSPQAKGRVERSHGVYQDRLVKELRLAGVGTIAEGNALLDDSLLDDHNSRFAVAPRGTADLHRPVPRGLDLRRVFCIEDERTMDNDWTVRHHGKVFQVIRRGGVLPPARGKVTVQEWLDGSLHLAYRGCEVAYEEITAKMPPRNATASPWGGAPRMVASTR